MVMDINYTYSDDHFAIYRKWQIIMLHTWNEYIIVCQLYLTE